MRRQRTLPVPEAPGRRRMTAARKAKESRRMKNLDRVGAPPSDNRNLRTMTNLPAPPELLAPAGNAETALAAFDAGADAVYCGLGRFNARERAENFTRDTLHRVIDFARANGKRVYVTFNTIIFEHELDAMIESLA